MHKKENASQTPASGDAWYAFAGPENDVAIATRVRFARNLANYPFPGRFRADDASQVQTLVFDSVAHSSQADSFQALPVSALDSLGAKILSERGVITDATLKAPSGGVIMRNDGKLSCTVNDSDHVHIIAFAPGLSCGAAFDDCRFLDGELQQTLQFAASYDYGFLTSSLQDCGSGMSLNVRLHLPSLSFAGRIPECAETLAEKGVDVRASFGVGFDSGASLGCYYQVSGKYAQSGNELDQIAAVKGACEYLISHERAARQEVAKNHPTQILDAVYRAYAKARFALLMPLREAVDIISHIKWGKDTGFITGIGYTTLHALLYRIQEGHLQFVLKNGRFNFSKDIVADDRRKTERLRALILQEAFEQTRCKGE
ncbi:MAG: hypothetical protein K6G80_02120 [Treponema sp.]|nr:hypothetical protein [Treponema sp.]